MADPTGNTVADDDELGAMAATPRPMPGVTHPPLQIDPFAGGAAPGVAAPAIRKPTEAPLRPEYQETYPETVGGTVGQKTRKVVDPKTGKKVEIPIPGETFVGKEKTPKELEDEKWHATTSKIMREDPAWERYFKTEERYPTPRDQFKSPLDTMAALAAKPETIRKDVPKILKERNRELLQHAVRSSTDPSTHRWYYMGQLYDAFVSELGPVHGAAMFRRVFSGPMAATTGGMSPYSNLRAAYYGNWLRHHGMEFPRAGEGWTVPYPVGGGQHGVVGNLNQYQKTMIGHNAEPFGFDNPKRLNFMQALEGDPQSFTWDEQMMKGMTGGKLSIPREGTYGLWERLGREEAQKAGMDPAEFQARAWHYFKNYLTGKPMIEQVNEMIERTHRLTGMPRDEVVRQGLILGRIPLFGLAALSFLADQDEQRHDTGDGAKRSAAQ